MRFVLALGGEGNFDFKTHLRSVVREARGWLATTIEYEAPWNRSFVSDLGLWPRLHIDGEGRSTIVFAVYSAGSITWIVAGGSGGGQEPRIEQVATATHELLTGSLLPPARQGIRFEFAGRYRVELSLAHWAPAIAPAGASAVLSAAGSAEPRAALFCVFGNGMLNLARIDLWTLGVTSQVLDVDRMTGFFPAIAARRGGVPAIAYKDTWGAGEFGATARDELLFFSYEQGNVVPPAELPLAPLHGRSGWLA